MANLLVKLPSQQNTTKSRTQISSSPTLATSICRPRSGLPSPSRARAVAAARALAVPSTSQRHHTLALYPPLPPIAPSARVLGGLSAGSGRAQRAEWARALNAARPATAASTAGAHCCVGSYSAHVLIYSAHAHLLSTRSSTFSTRSSTFSTRSSIRHNLRSYNQHALIYLKNVCVRKEGNPRPLFEVFLNPSIVDRKFSYSTLTPGGGGF